MNTSLAPGGRIFLIGPSRKLKICSRRFQQKKKAMPAKASDQRMRLRNSSRCWISDMRGSSSGCALPGIWGASVMGWVGSGGWRLSRLGDDIAPGVERLGHGNGPVAERRLLAVVARGTERLAAGPVPVAGRLAAFAIRPRRRRRGFGRLGGRCVAGRLGGFGIRRRGCRRDLWRLVGRLDG